MRKSRKQLLLLVFSCLLVVVAAGCGSGEKSPENVVGKMEETLNSIDGYKVAAEMTMHTGQEERKFEIDVWYKKAEENFYRVVLQDEENEGGQVILKNEEGVFVLTPALKKSFKFQKDWPESSRQPYLYQSLLKDVVTDEEAVLTTTEDHHVFLTKTNYQNNTNLPLQEIKFDKKTLTPVSVSIMDEAKNVLIAVEFKDVDVNPEFAEADFDRESILESSFAHLSEEELEKLEDFAVLYPLETLGAELVEKKEVTLDEARRVILTFKGEKNFTLIQEKPVAMAVSLSDEEMTGELVNLGHSVGAVTDDTVEWNYLGTDFYLASDELSAAELIEVAASIQGKGIK